MSQVLTFLEFSFAKLIPRLKLCIQLVRIIVDRPFRLGDLVSIWTLHECSHVEVKSWLDVIARLLPYLTQ